MAGVQERPGSEAAGIRAEASGGDAISVATRDEPDRALAAPLVFDVARGSCVDGPGIRTTLFLKGCPLRCLWCHNPEGQQSRLEIGVRRERCNQCGACRERCPSGAIDLDAEWIIERSRCTPCPECADACDALAIQAIGDSRSVEDLVEIALADRVYFEVSGGGVTLSGGEPLMHLDFVAPLVRRLKQEGIHVAVQTCGHFDFPRFEADVLPWVDYVLYDIKHVDSATHARLTGKGNERILENFRKLVKKDGITVVPRVPLVPELTATRDNLAGIARLFQELGIRSYRLLTYNPSGAAKWRRLGRKAPAELPVAPLSRDQEAEIRAEFDDWLGPPAPPDPADR
jgi:pyruvate formate lyase activating enzyme